MLANTTAPPKYAVSGHVYYDLWDIGTHDAGEPGEPGVTVYIDTNKDGAGAETGEPASVTDANGAYSFDSVAKGSQVREIVPRHLQRPGQRVLHGERRHHHGRLWQQAVLLGGHHRRHAANVRRRHRPGGLAATGWGRERQRLQLRVAVLGLRRHELHVDDRDPQRRRRHPDRR